MLKPQGASGKRLLSWIGQRTDTINRFPSQTFSKLPRWRIGLIDNFNMQIHGDLVSLLEERTEGFKSVRNTKAEVGLDAWRRLNHKYESSSP